MIVAVARATGLIVGAAVEETREWEQVQDFVDRLPPAERYASDSYGVYQEVLWPEGGEHIISVGKEETHTIESINANLRTYLKRLARRSRCFSRKLGALREAVRLFVWHYNRRQRVRNAYPQFRHALPLVF